jgi:hypothetical protein
MNLPSFSLLLTIIGFGAFAVIAAPETMPNKAGLDECTRLHPERYCRIANGFPVPPLKP